MPCGNRKQNKKIRGYFHFSIFQVQKNITPWKPEISLFRHFPKHKIVYSNGKKTLSISLKLNFTGNTLRCYGLNIV